MQAAASSEHEDKVIMRRLGSDIDASCGQLRRKALQNRAE